MSDREINVRIGGLTDAQAMALEDMLATWHSLGSQGASRWTAFFADGDGNFHPRITVDGQRPKLCDLLSDSDRWRGNEYRVDFDTIAWRLRESTGRARSEESDNDR